MYVKGVSTRQAEAVLREFGIEGLSSSQVSRAAAMLDEELEAWRTRPLGEIRYLILDARYEKMRAGGVVRDAAVLSGSEQRGVSQADRLLQPILTACPCPSQHVGQLASGTI